MAFPESVREALLIKSGRRCCICRRYWGLKIVVHHIVQPHEGGSDDESNGIPLCLNCHAEVKLKIDPMHPAGGTQFTAEELRGHRDRAFEQFASQGSWVMDEISSELIPCDITAAPPATPAVRVDLGRAARLARFRGYLYKADEALRCHQWAIAARHYRAALLLADHDPNPEGYEEASGRYLARVHLWHSLIECALERPGLNFESLVVGMGIDEHEVASLRSKAGPFGALRARDYFSLVAQEVLRTKHLGCALDFKRVRDLLILLHDPAVTQSEPGLGERADKLIRP